MRAGVVGELCRASRGGEDPIPCVGAAGMGCSLAAGWCFRAALVSRMVVTDPTLRNFGGGFLWLPVGLGLRLTPTLEAHTALSLSCWGEPEQPCRSWEHRVSSACAFLKEPSRGSSQGFAAFREQPGWREHEPHPGLRVLRAMPRSRAGLNLKCMILSRSSYL